MKTLSRTLIALLALLGTAFVGMQGCNSTTTTSTSASSSVTKKVGKCDGLIMVPIAIDANGCETVQPMGIDEAVMDALLAGLKKECYRIRVWKEHDVIKEKGELPLTACTDKPRVRSAKWDMMQQNGTGQTQRVMLGSTQAKVAFEKKMQAAIERSKKN